jgi:hypothetical protein
MIQIPTSATILLQRAPEISWSTPFILSPPSLFVIDGLWKTWLRNSISGFYYVGYELSLSVQQSRIYVDRYVIQWVESWASRSVYSCIPDSATVPLSCFSLNLKGLLYRCPPMCLLNKTASSCERSELHESHPLRLAEASFPFCWFTIMRSDFTKI